MTNKQIQTNSVKETFKLAERLASLLRPGDVITLEGDLGTGKTTFTKGIAKGLGIEKTVSSPTFTIIKEYSGDIPLYHMDVYRLEGSDEDIGFTEYFYGDGVTIVEWAQFIDDYLPDERLNITVNYMDERTRVFLFEPVGNRFESIIAELFES